MNKLEDVDCLKTPRLYDEYRSVTMAKTDRRIAVVTAVLGIMFACPSIIMERHQMQSAQTRRLHAEAAPTPRQIEARETYLKVTNFLALFSAGSLAASIYLSSTFLRSSER